MPTSPTSAPSAPDGFAAKRASLPFVLTPQQGEAARRLLSYVTALPLIGADEQLLATLIAIRAARDGTGNVTGQDLHSLRLPDAQGAVAALTALGWRTAGDLPGSDPEVPVAVTVPGLVDTLLISKSARSRVSGWTSRVLATRSLKKSSPAARLAALFLSAYCSSDCYGVVPGELSEQCHTALQELQVREFIVELTAGARYLLDDSVRHLSGLHPRSHDSAAVDRLRWEAWKDSVSPALRRHAEAVECCPRCALSLTNVAPAFMCNTVPGRGFPRNVRVAYRAWKDTQPDRGPRAAQFAAGFRAEHGHGPSVRQLCDGLGWEVERAQLRSFIIARLVTNGWLAKTGPVPWTLRPGDAAQVDAPSALALVPSSARSKLAGCTPVDGPAVGIPTPGARNRLSAGVGNS